MLRLWHKLTDPVVPLSPAEQRYAQLLTSLVVALSPLTFALLLLPNWMDSGRFFNGFTRWHLVALVLIGISLTYYWGRTGKQDWAAAMIVGVSITAILLVTVGENDLKDAYFMIIPIVIGMLFFNSRRFLIIFAASAAAILLLPFLMEDVPWFEVIFGPFGFLLFSSLMLSLTGYYHATNEQLRRLELEEKEERYRRLVELSPLLVIIHQGGPINYINPAGVQMLGGISPDDIVGKKTMRDFIHPDYIELARERGKVLFNDRRPVDLIEQKLIRLDGKVMVGEIAAVPFVYQGQPAAQVVIRDITDRKQAEDALRLSETKSNAVLSALPDLMFQMDREGRFLDYRDPGMGLFMPPDKFLGHSIREILPSIGDIVIERIAQALQTRDVQILDYELPAGDEIRYYESRLVANGDNEVVTIVRDITDRKRAEEALRRRDAILDALAYASEQLLRIGNLDVVLPHVLAQLGQAAHVSRVYIFQNQTDSDGSLCVSQIQEWTVKGQISQIDNPILIDLPYKEGLERWEQTLSAGHPLYGLVREFPAKEREILGSQGILSILVMPIFIGDAWWGFVGFDDCLHERQWLVSEIEALRNVAGILSAAITRQRIEAAEHDQRGLSDALRDTAALLNSTLDLDEVLERILIYLGRVLPHDSASIMLIDNQEARIMRSHGYIEHGLGKWVSTSRFPVEEIPTLQRMAHTGQPLFIPDTHSSPDWVHYPDTEWMRSYAGAPIMIEGQVIGFLHVDSATTNTYTQEHAERLHIFANQAALAIRNAQLFAAEREQRGLAEALQTAAGALNSTLQLDQVLERILSSLSGVVPLDAASIMLFEGDHARIVGSRGYANHTGGGDINNLQMKLSKSNCLHQIILSGQPLIIGDTATNAYWQDIPESRWVRSHLGAPIRQNGNVIGVINTDSATPNTYKVKQAAHLQAFADHAAIAIRNAQLFTAEQEQHTLAEALQNTAAVLNNTLRLNEVLDRVLTSLVGVVPHEASCIMMFTTDEVYVLGSRGYAERHDGDDISQVRFKIEDTPHVVKTIEKGEALIIFDTEDNPDWVNIPQTRWIRSHLEAPIRHGGKVIGVINLDSSVPGMYTKKHATHLQAFADHAAIAIRNAQLFDAEHEQRALAEALRDMAELLNSTLELDEVLERILSNLGRVAPHDAANIMLIRNGVTRVARQQHYEYLGVSEWLQEEHFPADKFSTLRQMMETNQPIVISDTHRNPSWVLRDETRWIRSYAAAPIILEGEVIGFLNTDSAIPGTYTTEHGERLQAFANQASIAIRNAQLFAAEREQRALSEALRDTAAAINASLELDDVLERILTTIGRVVKHDAANIMLLRGDIVYTARSRGYDEQGTGEWMRQLEVSVYDRTLFRLTAETGKRVVIFDTHLASDWKTDEHSDWIRSHVSVPIVIEERVIGYLNLDSSKPGNFTVVDADRLAMFADQTGVAIKNARLYERLIRYNEELVALYRSTSFLFTSLPMSLDLMEFSQQIAEAVVHEFRKTDCGVILLDAPSNELIRLARAGEYQVDATAPLRMDGLGLVPAAARSRDVVYCRDVTQDARYFPSDHRTRSELVVPLLTAQGFIGVLDLQNTEADAFNEQDIRLLTAFAERAAAAIENRQLYNEIQLYTSELENRVEERTIDLSVRNAVATTLSSSLDTNEMLNGVLQTTVDQLGVVGGAIYLLNSDASSLQMAAHIGISPDTLRLVTGITPDGLETRPIIDENLSIREQTGISAVLSVPIWRQEQIQGIITLVHDQTRPWRDDDFRMLDAIGRQIGVALANAELYSEAARGEAQVRAILQSVADGLLVFDQNANLILMNPAAEALFAFYPGGASKAARYLWEWLQEHHMLGNGTAESIEFALPITPLSGDVTPNFNDQCVLQHCMGTERPDLGWPCWLQPSGNVELQVRMCQIFQRIPRRAIQAHSAQVRDGEGSILGNVIALHDVTYYRELDELKGRFVSTVSHELRTPLSAMMLQVSTLLRYYDRIEEESRREMIGEIHEQTNILRELIEDILELSRFDAKRSMPQKQWFYMDDQCQDVIHSLQPMMNEKRINVLFEHESGPRHYYGDPNQLMRAFRNVLSNAVKYTPEDGRVTVRIQQHGTELHLSVEDTGIGIAPDEQPHVFERFFRAESASQIASGTGLGLSITKEIVDLHLGRLELLSQLGVGSTFTICLPIGDGDPPTQERQLL